MGTVTLPNIAAESSFSAAVANGKVDPLATEFNGNIENANIKSGAAIAAAKLNLATVAQNIAHSGTMTHTGVVTMTGKELLVAKGSDVASGTSIALGTDGNYFDITGTTNIETITAKQAGSIVFLQFDGALTLVDDDGNLELNGTDIHVQAEDVVGLICDGTNWACLSHYPPRPRQFTLTDAATIATNAAVADVFDVTLTDNRTLGSPSNSKDGMKKVWRFRQDGTGSRTITLNAVFRVPADIGTITLTTAAGDVDFMGCIYDGVDSKWDVVAFTKGSAS